MSASSAQPDQLSICTLQCRGRCCRYVTVSIDPPRGHCDWDEIRWWLAHGRTLVTKDEDGWMLHVETRCRHLTSDNQCSNYDHRMTTCSAYEADDCEFTGDVPYDVRLRSEEDLADHLERRGLKRGAAVARAVRAASSARKTRAG
ncbi:MAG: hypothetical protein ACC662_06090 [Planctomycetota bacterium]